MRTFFLGAVVGSTGTVAMMVVWAVVDLAWTRYKHEKFLRRRNREAQ